MSAEIEEARQQFAVEVIAGQEKLLTLAESEKIVTGVASIVTFSLVAIAIVLSWPIWVWAVAGVSLCWFEARHLRARRFIQMTTSAIARLREL